jgi:hypothetical protein
MLRTGLFAASLVFLAPGCAPLDSGTQTDSTSETGGSGETSEDPMLGPSKSRWSFELPSQGTKNDNKYIGPFCCTGVTAVVTNGSSNVGYGYFFTWQGQAYTNGTDSWMPDFEILLAGADQLTEPTLELNQGEIVFVGTAIEPGSVQTANVGDLRFTATVEHVDVNESHYIQMGTLKVRLDVDPIE